MKRILVVDDEPSICKALAMGLSEDYEVDVASHGKSGVKFGRQKKYDVVIIDLCLPDMEGFDVIREIKRHSPETISIIITGNGSMESSIEAIHLEVNDYIEKPLSMEAIKSSINRALKNKAAKRKRMRDQLYRIVELYREKSWGKESSPSRDLDAFPGQPPVPIPLLIHQINNPLTSIKGSAQLAMLKLGAEESGTIRNYLATIIQETEKISEINKKLMHMDRHSHGKPVHVNLKTLLHTCLDVFQELLILKGVSLEKNFDDLNVTLFGNPFDLEQVFKNLILNAIESMEESEEKQLTLSAAVSNSSSVSIQIQDTGCGIPQESFEEIFKHYVTTKENGNGLGLPVVKHVLEKLNGRITIESRINKGTTFTVILPLSERLTESEKPEGTGGNTSALHLASTHKRESEHRDRS